MSAKNEEVLNNLLYDLHHHINSPHQPTSVVSGRYAYYHYLCDGIDDRGWGCGYRTLQTLCSWIKLNKFLNSQEQHSVPSIYDIQQALVNMNDKPSHFLNSHQWIGSFEACICLDYFFDTSCKIHHIRSGENLFNGVGLLWKHFEEYGSPVMMGGDSDTSSKCILGITGNIEENCHLLVLDPHCSAKCPTWQTILEERWLSWRPINNFVESSFYNLCLPQCKSVID